jgi:hypothetical protein
VEDGLHGRRHLASAVHQLAHVLLLGRVDGHDLEGHALLLHHVLEGHEGLLRVGRPRGDQEVARAVVVGVAHQLGAEATRATRDEVGGVLVEDALGLLHGDLARLHAAVLLLLVVQEHDLADVLARLHELERLLDLVHREGRHRQAVVVALHEVPAHLAADLGGHGGVVQGQAVHVDGEERDVLAERQQAQAVVLEDVHLADLEEAARRAQGLDAQALVLARQRVQHDIDSQAVRVAHQVIEPRRGARVVHVLHAHGPHQLALVGRPRRGVDHRAEVLADGDGRVADTTRSAVDQHLRARMWAPGGRREGQGLTYSNTNNL